MRKLTIQMKTLSELLRQGEDIATGGGYCDRVGDKWLCRVVKGIKNGAPLSPYC